MTTIRQDAWSTDEDLILAEVVLRHIREGSTQLSAFEEVGERLSRTSAACGFRWNSAIRKKYESAVALAKKQRTKGKKQQPAEPEEFVNETSEEIMEPVVSVKEEKDIEKAEGKKRAALKKETVSSELTMKTVLSFLADYEEEMKKRIPYEEIEKLKRENELLQEELEKVKEEKKIMTEDYRALLSIMDRARKLSI
ncbi:RsfA family transcriptional regulator [Alkalihalobacillus sp. MEB130]|uniref:RsfA family transcriptional regulator n=1 Tax=Alkalihalobacillus sp. MEB130 TaxID=2976704 RepID=UPI0028DDC891|nr:RsfA family transcriptional regulator [Alkalihalobacillus sp. MEB130]MDT8859134.1 RsfA family transcriptional regulator [Alkalihalobacillus sp. MEB130]